MCVFTVKYVFPSTNMDYRKESFVSTIAPTHLLSMQQNSLQHVEDVRYFAGRRSSTLKHNFDWEWRKEYEIYAALLAHIQGFYG